MTGACAIVVAAGKGSRFGGSRPKQFLPLAGKPLLTWPLRAFERSKAVASVVLVVAPAFLPWARRFVRREGLRKVRAVVAGGAERAASVRNGFRAVPPGAAAVLVHDAARALVSPQVIGKVAAAALASGAALAAWPVPDTLKKGGAGGRGKTFVRGTVSREKMWLAQTPQGFRADVAARIFRGPVPRKATDDAQLAERAGTPPVLVPASPVNFKVTLPADFALARAWLLGKKG